MASATTLVHWLGSGEPPAQLMAHLKTRGLSLTAGRDAALLSPARLSCIVGTQSPIETASLAGRRVAVLHPDPGLADVLAQSLRERCATVKVLSLDPAGLDRLEGFDPDVVLVEPADFTGGCWEIVRALWTHPRLRWSTIVLTRDDRSGLGFLNDHESDRVGQTIQHLSAEYDLLVQRAASGAPVDGWLATLGPARTLRALVGSGATLRVSFESSAHAIEVDIGDHLVKGARETDAERPDQALLGTEAIARLLCAEQAKILVKRRASPALTNVMASLDDALRAARFSSPPTSPSLPSSHIPRRDSRLPHSDAIATVRPPGHVPGSNLIATQPNLTGSSAGRIYPFPVAIPPLPTPNRVPGVVSPRAISTPAAQAVVHGRPVASAVALNFEEVESIALAGESIAAERFSDAVRQGLHSGIVETLPEVVREIREPADLEHLLGEPGESDDSLSESKPLADKWRSGLTLVKERLLPAKLWASRLSQDADKAPLRLMLVSAFAVFCLCLLVRSDGSTAAMKASAGSTGSALKIRIRKMPHEEQVTASAAGGDEQLQQGVDPGKPAARRASELVSGGHALRRQGRLAQAEELYRESLKVYPGYPRALAGLGRLALQRGDAASAVRFARSLVRARPQQAASHLLLGDAERAAGNLPAATSAWTAAAKRGDRVAKSRLKVVAARSFSAKVTSRAYSKFQGLEVVENGSRRYAN